MTGKEYQRLAMRTNDGKCTDRLADILINEEFIDGDFGGVVNACFGLPGEVGEVCDIIKKWIFHGHDLDKNELKKEISDVMWYVAMLCESFGFDLDDIMQTNIDKLIKRYPDGFSTQASINRTE